MTTFVLCTSDYGPMIINANDTGVGWQIANNRCHEPEVVNFGRNLATKMYEQKKRVAIVDIGANIGTCTVPWARHVKDWGTVQAYEAQETVFYALAGNIVLNNLMNARAKLAAVTDVAGTMMIPQMNHNVKGNFGGFHLREEDNRKNNGDNGPDQPISYKPEHLIAVPAVSLDDEDLDACDILKIDVEGMEAEVLRGATNLIWTKYPVIIAEHIHCGAKAITDLLDYEYEYFSLSGNIVCVPNRYPELVKFVKENPPEWKYRL